MKLIKFVALLCFASKNSIESGLTKKLPKNESIASQGYFLRDAKILSTAKEFKK